MTSVQNIGAVLAMPFAPFVSDGLGRRRGLLIGSCIMLGGVALQTQSASIEQFILSRGLSASPQLQSWYRLTDVLLSLGQSGLGLGSQPTPLHCSS